MSHKRPLEVAPPAASAPGAPLSPRKRLRRAGRRAGFVMMWLRRRPRPTGVEQMAVLIRQMRVEMVKLFMLLMVLVVRLGNVERLLLEQPYVLRRLLEEHFGIFQRLNILEGFPQTGGGTRMLKLLFVDAERPEDPLYTRSPVQWQNGANAKVALFENGSQITQGDLSKLQIEILPVHDDFFTERGPANFTKEELNRQIYMCNGKESVLTTVNLTNGEAYLGSFFFTESSYGKRLRFAARVKCQDLAVRVQEATSYSFVVKDHRSLLNKKSYPPSKEEEIYCLEKISPKGKRYNALVDKNIRLVKHLMRNYYRDQPGLRKLTGMKNEDWNAMIKHALTSGPGDEIYSYRVEEENAVLFFNDFFCLVGMLIDDIYVPYHANNLSHFQQRKVNNWKMSAYKKFEDREKLGSLIPDYAMNDDGLLVPVSPNGDSSPSIHQQVALQEFGRRSSLLEQNRFSSAVVSQYDVAGPSTRAKQPLQQYACERNMHQESGQQDPSMHQDENSNYLTQINILNGQGSCSAQSTIPSHNTVTGQEDGLVTAHLSGRHNGYLSSTTTDAAVGVSQGNCLNEDDEFFRGLSPIVESFEQNHAHAAYQGVLPDNNEILEDSIPFQQYWPRRPDTI